jgi:hypothetical protein
LIQARDRLFYGEVSIRLLIARQASPSQLNLRP